MIVRIVQKGSSKWYTSVRFMWWLVNPHGAGVKTGGKYYPPLTQKSRAVEIHGRRHSKLVTRWFR